MQDIIIRKAIHADLETLYSFEQGVINAERPFDPTLKAEHIHYYDLQFMLEANHIQLLVAEFRGEVIASGYARIEQSKPYLRHHLHAYLGFMYVHPDHRGKGINAMIIGALKEWAGEKGIKELRLDVYHDNLPAVKAYEKFGFKKHMILMRYER